MDKLYSLIESDIDITQKIIDIMKETDIKGCSIYYWFSKVDEDIDNMNLLEKMDEKYTNLTIKDIFEKKYLNHNIINSFLETILDCPINKINIPLLPLITNNISSELIYEITKPIEELSAPLTTVPYLPVELIAEKKIIADCFEIPYNNVYYVVNFENVSNIQSILYHCCDVYGIRPNLQPVDSINIHDIVGKIIIGLQKRDSDLKALCIQFLKIFMNDSSNISKLIIDIIENIRDLESLTSFNKTILSRINNNVKKTTTNIRIQKSLAKDNLCVEDIPKDTIYNTLKSYKNMRNGYRLTYDGMCPLHVRYIYKVFPYYKNNIIEVRNDHIYLTPVQCVKNCNITKLTYKKIPNLFNGDFNTFQKIANLGILTEEESLNMLPMIHNMVGFACETIIAQNLRYHFNYYGEILNPVEMFQLLSKLTKKELLELDSDYICNVMAIRNKSLTQLFPHNVIEFDAIKLNNVRVKEIINKIIETDNMMEKYNLALSNRFLDFEIVKTLLEITIKTDKVIHACILLLYFSKNISDAVRKLLHSLIEMDKIDINSINISQNNTCPIYHDNISIYDLYAQYNQKYSTHDLISYLKETSDYNIVPLINRNETI